MKLYRYEAKAHCYTSSSYDEEWATSVYAGTSVELITYEVIRETERSYLINYKRWIRKEGNKIFARSTPEKALEDFIYRRTKMIRLLESRLKRAKDALEAANKVKERAMLNNN